MERNSTYKDSLKQSSLKNTKHRCEILNILDHSESPLSAGEVYKKLSDMNIKINLSTVYRILEVLTEKKLVNRLNIVGDKKALYETNKTTHRHYLVCTGCKMILPINYCPLSLYEAELEKKTNFKIEGHNLDIYGLCPDCQNKIL